MEPKICFLCFVPFLEQETARPTKTAVTREGIVIPFERALNFDAARRLLEGGSRAPSAESGRWIFSGSAREEGTICILTDRPYFCPGKAFYEKLLAGNEIPPAQKEAIREVLAAWKKERRGQAAYSWLTKRHV